MNQENLLLWHDENKKSFWKEEKILNAQAPVARSAPEVRNPAEAQKIKLNNLSLKKFRFELLGTSEQPQATELDLPTGFDQQTDNLQDWFERINIFSYDEAYESRFNTLFSNIQGKTEATIQGEEKAEIARIRHELGIGKGAIEAITTQTSAQQGKESLTRHLHERYHLEYEKFSKNIDVAMSQSLHSIDRELEELMKTFPQLKNYPDVQAEILQPTAKLKEQKQRLQQSVTNHYSLNHFSQSVSRNGEGTIREDFQKRLQQYAKESGRSASNLEYWEREKLWKEALTSRIGNEKIEFKEQFTDFCRNIGKIRLNIAELKEFLEKNSQIDIEEVYKKIQPEELLDVHYPSNGKPLKDFIREKLETETDPIRRAQLASTLIADSQSMIEELEQSGELQKFMNKEERDKYIKLEEAENERKELTLQDFNGSIESALSKLKGVNDIITGLEKKFLYSTDKNGNITEKETLNPESRADLQRALGGYKSRLLQSEEGLKLLKQIPDAQTNDEVKKKIKDIVEDIIDCQFQVEKFDDQILKQIESETVIPGGIKISFVAPIAFKNAIKNIYAVFTGEIERGKKKDAANLQTQFSKSLKWMGGYPGNCFAIAEQKGIISNKNLGAEERGEYKYEGHDHKALLKVFEGWNDHNPQHLRAILEEMGKRGLIRWEDEKLWEHLHTVTGMTMPEQAKQDAHIRDVFLDKMFYKAFNKETWFKDQKNDNTKAFVSKYEGKYAEAKKVDTEKRNAKTLKGILESHYSSAEEDLNDFGQMPIEKLKTHQFKKTEADPHLYASVLVHQMSAIGMTAEDLIFYLVRGVASGLLPHEFLAHFAGDKLFFNVWPSLNYFRRISYKDLLELDKRLTGVHRLHIQSFKGDANAENREKYLFRGDKESILKLLHNDLVIDDGVKDRVNRVIERWNEVDKDVQQEALNKVSPAELTLLLGKYSGKSPLGEAKQKNGITGWSTRLSVFDLRDLNSTFPKATANNRIGTLAKSLATGMLFFAANDGRVRWKDFEPMGESDWNSKPGADSGAGLSTREYANITQNFIATFLESIPDQSIGKWSKAEVLSLAFSRPSENDDERKKQNEIIQALSLGGIIEKLIGNNKERFAFLMERWNKEEAFANYYDAKKSKALLTTGDNHEAISDTLKFDAAAFEEWKKDKPEGL